MTFPEELISRNKEIISNIIIKFNEVENSIKEIITVFIDSERNEFIKNILLNNLILNFSSKFRILQYIIESQEIKVDKNFNKSIKILMSKRNIIAHSDSLIDYNVIPTGPDLFAQYVMKIPSYMLSWQRVESKEQITLNNGKIENSDIEKIHSDFLKYYEKSTNELNIIMKEVEKIITHNN